MHALPDDLARLANAYGVATSYLDANRRPKAVGEAAIRRALAAMDVRADAPDEVETALAELRGRAHGRLVPAATVVVRDDPDRASARLHVPVLAPLEVRLELEGGGSRELRVDPPHEPGRRTHEGGDGDPDREVRTVPVPDDVPLGYHRLLARTPAETGDGVLIVAPPACPGVGQVAPGWGWMLQLYALRSTASWGIGDLADLREITAWSGGLGADFVVVNPLHAPAPTLPVQRSPYYPSSRRFVTPLALRVEDVPAYAAAAPAVRAEVDRLAAGPRAANRADRIDYDAAWTAKLAALELLHGVEDGHAADRAAFRAAGGRPLEDFAVFCALAEHHGAPWQIWPEALHDPQGVAVAGARAELADRIAFHVWLQWCCDRQLAAVQQAAVDAGMAIGVVHDLAVGVDPGGADAWALQDVLAGDVTVGAPPDAFNQRGQDWRLPPLRPDRLADTGYAPFREMLAAVLRHAGGIRIDHVMGLFRLWWVPEGRSAADGAYVSYPAADLLAVLALEAHRAGAIVVGEDLGTVADEVRHALLDAGVFGSRVLYFERTEPDASGADRRLRADEYPQQSLASVTTHDLPTAAGWWADEAVRVQARLGLLGDDTTLEDELARTAAEKAELRALLLAGGDLDPDADDPAALREAMHAFLARSGSLLVAAQPADAVGDLRQPNLPGTTDEYPSWRLPVSAVPAEGGAPRPVLLEELRDDPRVRRLAAILEDGRAAPRAGAGPQASDST